MESMCVLRQRIMFEPHWYLSILAVDPVKQKGGIGSALLQPMLKRADNEKMPIYLWSDQPLSIPFYQLHGFAIADQVIEPQSKLCFWAMRRECEEK